MKTVILKIRKLLKMKAFVGGNERKRNEVYRNGSEQNFDIVMQRLHREYCVCQRQ